MGILVAIVVLFGGFLKLNYFFDSFIIITSNYSFPNLLLSPSLLNNFLLFPTSPFERFLILGLVLWPI